MREDSSIVTATAARIFSDLGDPQSLSRTCPDGTASLWQALEEAGLTLAWVPELQGGAGGEMADGFAVVDAAARFAAPVPLAETLLAGWLLARAGMAVPSGVMTVAPARPGERLQLGADGILSGVAHSVPAAQQVRHLAVLAEAPRGACVALVERAACWLTQGINLAGDSVDTVNFDRVRPVQVAPAPAGLDHRSLMLMGAVLRSVAIAGALQAILALSVRYADERVAFERPIAKFQAVQHNLARLAGEAAAAVAAAGSAADAIAQSDQFDNGVFLEVAAAKIRCAEAAQEGVAIAHQVHGAIGFTHEHILHRFTLRMLAWRDDFGSESHWAVELGRLIAVRGADAFWPMVASR